MCCNVGTVVGHVSTCCLDNGYFFSLFLIVEIDGNVSSEYLTPECEHYYFHPPSGHLEGGRD
jgi:hypothetical protein